MLFGFHVLMFLSLLDVGTEYKSTLFEFVQIPMFIGGKNKDPNPRFQIATAYLAYDCTHNILCGAAHLDADYMADTSESVVKSEEDTWIRIGGNASDTKLKPRLADEFEYVGKPSDPSFIIGYEGCWNTSGLNDNIMDNFVEVHFVTTSGDTVSSGKPVKKGNTICVKPDCSTQPPTRSPSPGRSPSKSPSQKPTVSPSQSPTRSPIEGNGNSLAPTGPPMQCCVSTGICPLDDLTFELPLLNLIRGSSERPFINGTIDQDGDGIGDGYFGWSGKSDQTLVTNDVCFLDFMFSCSYLFLM
jgi:hypothetical protein